MDDRRSEPGGAPAAPVSADPVTEQQLREPVEPVLAGRVPDAMDEAIGTHDGSDQAGASGWTTSQGAGSDTRTDVSEGRVSTQADVAADDTLADDRDLTDDGTPGAPGSTSDRVSAPSRAPEAPDQATATPVDAVDEAVARDVVALLDLPRWTEHLHALPSWRDGDRASSMLLRQPPVRVLLSALRRDAELGSDTAQETLMLLVLSGAASIEWRGEVARIGQGELAVVPAGGGWRVTSEADETLVLSTFWGTPGTGVADEAGR
jgi:hypothetical protein